MGIKDNFSQAVKELWKKDGQSETPAKDNNGGTLKDYLEPNGAQRPVQGAEVGSSGVPLETPYYPNTAAAPAAKQSGEPAQDNNAVPEAPNQAPPQQGAQFNAQYNQGGAAQPNQNQGYQQPDNAGQPYYRNDQQAAYNQQAGYNRQDGYNQQPGYNQQSGYNQGGEPQGGYSQGGYQQGGYRQEDPGNYNVNRSLNKGGAGGGYVPPESGGGLAAQSSNETDEVTVISKNTNIDGNVRSLANMHIDGNIKGNVETTKNVEMSGKIVGDITCNNAGMNSAAMQGNVSLKGRMRMDRDTILIGDLSSQYADINGRIRGKLDIVGKAELKRDAIVFGDINASTIAVTDGAIIQGYVNTTFLSKEDSRNVFPEAISLENKSNPNNSSNN